MRAGRLIRDLARDRQLHTAERACLKCTNLAVDGRILCSQHAADYDRLCAADPIAAVAWLAARGEQP